jgi:hypothetical protein
MTHTGRAGQLIGQLVDSSQQRLRDGKAERLGSLEANHQFELGGLTLWGAELLNSSPRRQALIPCIP